MLVSNAKGGEFTGFVAEVLGLKKSTTKENGNTKMLLEIKGMLMKMKMFQQAYVNKFGGDNNDREFEYESVNGIKGKFWMEVLRADDDEGSVMLGGSAEEFVDVPEHTHPVAEHFFILKGNVTVMLAGQSFELASGDCLTIPANTKHATVMFPHSKLVIIEHPNPKNLSNLQDLQRAL